MAMNFFSSGNLAAIRAVSKWDSNVSFAAVLTAATVLVLSTSLFKRPLRDPKIHYLSGFNIVHAWRFFTRRFDFLSGNFKNTGKKFFEFYVLQNRVVALRGEEQRRVFYTHQNLSMMQGHQFLVGAAPDLKDINLTEDGSKDFETGFYKRLLAIQHKERVKDFIPVLLDDISRQMKDWGREGAVNPFREVHDIIFQMTIRLAACRELAEDKVAVSRLIQIYWDLEHGVTPTSVLLPWFPSAARKRKNNATKELYGMFYGYIEARRRSPVPNTDAVDLLLADGCSTPTIVSTIMGIIFAGVINTGVGASWALLHLGNHPSWKKKAMDELKSLVAGHSHNLSSDHLHRQLASIPLQAWEEETPVLDLIIRETLRLTMTGAPTRRIVYGDLEVGGLTVKLGDYVVYSQADAHLNPEIYSNPHAFDPERYLPGREEDRKEANAYLAWGAGRHPCAGMKVAKVEIKLVLASLLLGYDYKLVDSTGQYPGMLPVPDRNDIHQSRPVGNPVYIDFKRLVD